MYRLVVFRVSIGYLGSTLLLGNNVVQPPGRQSGCPAWVRDSHPARTLRATKATRVARRAADSTRHQRHILVLYDICCCSAGLSPHRRPVPAVRILPAAAAAIRRVPFRRPPQRCQQLTPATTFTTRQAQRFRCCLTYRTCAAAGSRTTGRPPTECRAAASIVPQQSAQTRPPCSLLGTLLRLRHCHCRSARERVKLPRRLDPPPRGSRCFTAPCRRRRPYPHRRHRLSRVAIPRGQMIALGTDDARRHSLPAPAFTPY